VEAPQGVPSSEGFLAEAADLFEADMHPLWGIPITFAVVALLSWWAWRRTQAHRREAIDAAPPLRRPEEVHPLVRVPWTERERERLRDGLGLSAPEDEPPPPADPVPVSWDVKRPPRTPRGRPKDDIEVPF
jgi:hypothetical protein